MNEIVYVEFLATGEDKMILIEKLETLGKDFTENNAECVGDWYRISGSIHSAFASVIKLQDPFLSDRMRISHIPMDLKNKYRK